MSDADKGLAEVPEVVHMKGTPTGGYMTNEQYWRAAEKKVRDLKKAALDLIDEMHHPPWYDGFFTGGEPDPYEHWLETPWGSYSEITDREDLDKELKVPIETWRTELLHFVTADLDKAVAADKQWYEMAKRFTALTNGGKPKGTVISESLATWKGRVGSAAERFRQYHCNEINEMIQYQALTTNSFRMIMQGQAALIAYGRYRALSIVDQTIEALKAETVAEEKENQEEMREFYKGIGTTIASLGSGPGGVIAAGGATLASQLPKDEDRPKDGIKGEEAWEITKSMMERLVGLRTNIQTRSGGLQNALRELDPLLTGQDAEKLLPAAVNL